MTDVPSPNACRHCDVDRQEHVQLYAPDVGWHGWTEPSDELRKARMLARRNTADSLTNSPSAQ